MHAPRRDVFYAREGAVCRRHLQDQTGQAWCLAIATDAISTWNRRVHRLAIQELRGAHMPCLLRT